MLKPNKIARTVYPDQPCTDFNEWSASITRAEIQHSADDFKAKFDALWDAFKRDIQRNS
jgi:hypothetical protein